MSETGTGARRDLSAGELEAYRARREALLAAVLDLEAEVATLETQTRPDAARVRAALATAAASFARHVEESEAPDGLLARITDEAPWLTVRVTRLRDEHEALHRALAQLERRSGGDEDPRALVAEARDLAAQLSAHRHRGTELLQDAFSLDLSAGE